MKPALASILILLSSLIACQRSEPNVHVIGLDVSGSISDSQRNQTLVELMGYLREDRKNVMPGDRIILVPIHAATSTAGTVNVILTSPHQGRRGEIEIKALRSSVIALADSLMRLKYGRAAHGTDLFSFFGRMTEWKTGTGRILVFSDMTNSSRAANFERNDPMSYVGSIEPADLSSFTVRVILPATAQGTAMSPELTNRLKQFWEGYLGSSNTVLESWGTNL